MQTSAALLFFFFCRREKSRDQEREKKRDQDDEEEVHERRRLERKLRDKEAAYQEVGVDSEERFCLTLVAVWFISPHFDNSA